MLSSSAARQAQDTRPPRCPKLWSGAQTLCEPLEARRQVAKKPCLTLKGFSSRLAHGLPVLTERVSRVPPVQTFLSFAPDNLQGVALEPFAVEDVAHLYIVPFSAANTQIPQDTVVLPPAAEVQRNDGRAGCERSFLSC